MFFTSCSGSRSSTIRSAHAPGFSVPILPAICMHSAASPVADFKICAGDIPAFGQPMQDNRLNALALAYRCIYVIVGSTIAARFASRDSMLHAERGRFTFG